MSDSPQPKRRGTDIGKQRIGQIYAEALLDAAGSTQNADKLLVELGAFVNEVFERVPDLEELLGSPRVPAEEKIALLDKMLKNRAEPDLLKFLKVVCAHDRLDCLRAIYAEAYSLQNERKGIVEIEMVTAQPADAKLVQEVKDALTAKLGTEIELRTSTDPSLIGGVTVRVGDKVLDASVQQQLRLIREQAVSTASHDIRAHTERFAL